MSSVTGRISLPLKFCLNTTVYAPYVASIVKAGIEKLYQMPVNYFVSRRKESILEEVDDEVIDSATP
jgi:hypothetical protein